VDEYLSNIQEDVDWHKRVCGREAPKFHECANSQDLVSQGHDPGGVPVPEGYTHGPYITGLMRECQHGVTIDDDSECEICNPEPRRKDGY